MNEQQIAAAKHAEMAEAWKPWEGQLIDGKFTLRRYLGGSDHSAVFLTEAPEGGEAVIKMTPLLPGGSAAQVAKTSQLSHGNLLRMLHSGQCRVDEMDCAYAVLERAKETLEDVLAKRALGADECRDTLPPLLDPLAYLHEKGVAHGRLKPSNILKVGDRWKVSSDGLGSTQSLTELSPYDAPERLTTGATPAADVWSLGITLFEALKRQVPLPDQIERRQLLPPDAAPAALRDIVDYSLETDPRVRWTIVDIQSRLRPALREMPSEIAEKHPVSPKRFLIPAILALLLLVGIWAVPKYFAKKAPPAPAPDAAPASQPEEHSPLAVPQAKAAAPETVKASVASNAATPAAPPPGIVNASNVVGLQSEVLQTVLPEPSLSARQSIQGIIHVGVKVQVDGTGKVITTALDPAGPSKYFANQAVQAARRWEFAPAQEAANRRWMLNFEFRKSGTKAVPVKLKTHS